MLNPIRALIALRKVLGVCATDACRACRPGDRGQAYQWVAHPALRRTSRLKNDTALTAHCAVRRARLRYLRVQMVYLISSLQIRQAWGPQSSSTRQNSPTSGTACVQTVATEGDRQQRPSEWGPRGNVRAAIQNNCRSRLRYEPLG